MVNIVLILIVLKPQILSGVVRKSFLEKILKAVARKFGYGTAK